VTVTDRMLGNEVNSEGHLKHEDL